jgi:hypothetical protein
MVDMTYGMQGSSPVKSRRRAAPASVEIERGAEGHTVAHTDTAAHTRRESKPKSSSKTAMVRISRGLGRIPEIQFDKSFKISNVTIRSILLATID